MGYLVGDYKSGDAILNLEHGENSGELIGYISNYSIDGRGYVYAPTNLKGEYQTIEQGSETFYLVNLWTIGTYENNKAKKMLPMALSFSGFITKGNNMLHTQLSQAFEFDGLAEGVSGNFIAWEKA